MNVDTKFSFDDNGTRGFGGAFTLSSGKVKYETFEISEFGASAAFGKDENYLAAQAQMSMRDFTVGGGIFLGRACSIEPIALANEKIAENLYNDTGGSFTGALAYGYGAIPISEALGIPSSCMFRIKAGVGTGVFYFFEGPTYGGVMDADVSGQALCVVSISGGVDLVGVKSGDDFRFSGNGRIGGKAGKCPFCVKFRKSVSIKYINEQWKVSY